MWMMKRWMFSSVLKLREQIANYIIWPKIQQKKMKMKDDNLIWIKCCNLIRIQKKIYRENLNSSVEFIRFCYDDFRQKLKMEKGNKNRTRLKTYQFTGISWSFAAALSLALSLSFHRTVLSHFNSTQEFYTRIN